MSAEARDTEGTIFLTLDLHAEAVDADPGQTIKPPDPEPGAHAGLPALTSDGAARFELGRAIGEGGVGLVHVATQRSLSRTVALKKIRPEFSDKRAAKALIREAWVTGSLEHPGMVPVYDVGLGDDGRPFLAMKRIEGETWSCLIDEPERLTEGKGVVDLLGWHLRTLIAVCNAVAFAHSRGVVHRDLKPENVMVGPFGEVYVLDWGIAVGLHPELEGHIPLASKVRHLAGTPSYMAPEMLGGGTIDERTDVYLLGGLLHEVITGRPPHEGAGYATLEAVIRASSPLRPEGPSDLVDLVMQALAKDPAARPPSVEAFRGRIEGYLARRGADRLVEEALARVDDLRRLIDTDDPDLRAVNRRFGEARFGFEQALVIWPDLGEAGRGLADAYRMMIRFELDAGRVSAASRLLASWDVHDAALSDEVRDAVARATHQATEFNRVTGLRTRWFTALLLGAIWTFSPGMIRVGGVVSQYGQKLLYTAGLLFVLLVLGVVGRSALSRTFYNRSTWRSMVFMLVVQLLFLAVSWNLGLPWEQTAVLLSLNWFTVCGMAAMTLDGRLIPATVCFGAAAWGSSVWPEQAALFHTAGDGVLTLTIAVAWFPGWDRLLGRERD